ncbi:MAG TPA: hypothetical protein VGN64_01640 [Dyadobacter sp.]|nr:hypothetical protein [Dyadobacter sp.]
MTDQQNFDRMLENYKANFQLKYNIGLDDWSAANILEAKEQFDEMKLRLDANLQQNKMLYDRFKGSIKTLQFKSGKDAFLYGLGSNILYGSALLLVIVLIFQWQSSGKQYQKIQSILSRYENVEAFENLIGQGKLKTENGVQYLILEQGNERGGNIYGQHYWYDAKKKIVKVPLKAAQ